MRAVVTETVTELIARSNRLGAEPENTNYAGGNTSAKGVDVDPVLIAAAEEDHPGPTFLVGDLAELDLPARGVEADFDVIVSAGNVMGFLAP